MLRARAASSRAASSAARAAAIRAMLPLSTAFSWSSQVLIRRRNVVSKSTGMVSFPVVGHLLFWVTYHRLNHQRLERTHVERQKGLTSFMKTVDDVGWMLLNELQADARLSFRELGRRVGLSAPAVAERVKRMETAGIIKGYHVHIDLGAIGLPITAMVRATPHAGKKDALEEAATSLPEVRECLRVTGSEHVWMKISAASLGHLDDALHHIWDVAETTTNVVLSTLVEHRPVAKDLVPDEA